MVKHPRAVRLHHIGAFKNTEEGENKRRSVFIQCELQMENLRKVWMEMKFFLSLKLNGYPIAFIPKHIIKQFSTGRITLNLKIDARHRKH